MLDWLTSVFGKQAKPPIGGPNAVVEANAQMIAAGLRRLEAVGLLPPPNMRDDFAAVSRRVAKDNAAIAFLKPPTEMTWAKIALRAQPFRNALCLRSRRYDGATFDGATAMIADIVALAGDEWRVDGVDVAASSGADSLQEGALLNVSVRATPTVEPFRLTLIRSVDWSLIPLLNERLPANAKGRFAAAGGAVVFVPAAQIAPLNTLTGWDFSMTPNSGVRVATQ